MVQTGLTKGKCEEQLGIMMSDTKKNREDCWKVVSSTFTDVADEHNVAIASSFERRLQKVVQSGGGFVNY